MPEASDEFVAQELASALGETRAAAGDIVSLAQELEVNLPGTRAAFRAGILNQRKAAIIASATAVLDPAEARAAEAKVLAADQRVTAWAKELRKAGLQGGMDALRARAYLDILLGMDSRPLGSRPDGTRQDPDPGPGPAPGGPLAEMIPPGFAGQVTLTIPEATLTGRADRPGELGGIGPVDPRSRSKYIGSLPDRASVDGPDRVLICFYAHHC